MRNITILAFGDSITYGAWDIDGSGWMTRLRNFLDNKADSEPNFDVETYNLGIPGETTDGLVKRFVPETEFRLRGKRENIFIFAYGANDAVFVPSKNEFRVSPQAYENNFEDVLAKAKNYGDKVILINITPVVEKMTAHPEGKDKSRLDEYVKNYNSKLLKIAQKHNVVLLDVYSDFESENVEKFMCEDGLHPNALGHTLIFNKVRDVLTDNNL